MDAKVCLRTFLIYLETQHLAFPPRAAEQGVDSTAVTEFKVDNSELNPALLLLEPKCSTTLVIEGQKRNKTAEEGLSDSLSSSLRCINASMP